MAIPENRKIPAEQLKGLLDPNPNQIKEINGFATVVTPYESRQNTIIDFSTWGKRGFNPSSPVYDASILESSINFDNIPSNGMMFLSVITIPSFISSPPAYLAGNITGSLILGYAHINDIRWYLDTEYDSVAKKFVPKVYMTIVQGEDANEDPAPPDASKIIHLRFNENKDLSIDPELLNESIYSQAVPSAVIATVLNPDDAQWNNLGGGNYSLQTGEDESSSFRSQVLIEISEDTVDLFDTDKLTVICRFRRRNGSPTTGDELIAGTMVEAEFKGWKFWYQNSATRLRFEASNGVALGNRNGSGAFGTINDDDSFRTVAVTWDGDTDTVAFYQKSVAKSIPFGSIGGGTIDGMTIVSDLNIIRLDKTNHTGTPNQQKDKDELRIYNEVLSVEEIEAIMDELDPDV